MKVQRLLAALAAGAIACTPVMAQKEAPKPQPAKPAEKAPAAQPGEKKMTPSEEAAMKAMIEAGTPGEGQKNIEQLAGHWGAVIKHRMDPNGPWEESHGTEDGKMMYEGRYLHSTFKSNMEGMPFEGTSVFAYDNTARAYQSTWVDSMSTGIFYLSGTYDAAKKSWSLKGDMADPMQGGKKKTTRMVITIHSPDKHTSEFFEPGPDGKEMKVMEITYTRGGSESHADKPAEKPAK